LSPCAIRTLSLVSHEECDNREENADLGKPPEQPMSAITAIVGGCVLEPKQEIGAVKDHPNPSRVGPLIHWSCLKTFVSSPVVVYDFN